jgi:hypothetical protein
MTKYSESLSIGEIITVDVYRAREGGTWNDKENIPATDLVTNAGRSFLADRISTGDTVNSAMAYMAIGSGSTAAALGDTTIQAEIDRKALSTNSATNNLYTATATWGGAADSVTSAVIVEAGVLNHASSGEGTPA